MISVITVTYNNYDDLNRTLHSLKNVDGIESVVVNGGNCNKTKKLLSNYDGIAISEPDKGISDAFNKGVTHANGENVMFLNSGDVLLSPEYLKEAEKTLSFNPEISFVHSDLLYEDRLSGDIRLTALQPFFFKSPPLGRGMPYHHQSMVVRKKVFEKTGLFNLQYKISMDFDWVCRLHKHKLNGFYWNKDPVVNMDGGGISALREHLVIWESLRALRDNKLLNIKNLYGISVRILFFLSRRILELLGMSEILAKLKKEKHNLLWQRSRDLAIKHNFRTVKTKPEQVSPTTLPLDWSKSFQKKIGLNGLLIHDYPTGLSRYSYELIRRILTKWEGNSVAYSASPDLNREFPNSTSTSVPRFNYPANFRSNSVRLSWEQLGLRYSCFIDKLDLLYSPIAEGILFPRIPQIITVHDLLPFHYPSLLPRWVPYYEYFLPAVIKGSTAVVCVSEFTRLEVLERYPSIPEEKLKVIHGGVDLDRFHPCSPGVIKDRYEINDYLLCVGEVRPYKNIENVFRALGLWSDGPQLAISGSILGNHKAKLEKLASSLNIENRVTWLGYVPDDLLPNLYSEATAFIFPSLYEGFGLPLVEAMACGCPTISSNRASLPEIGGKSAHFFDPMEISDMAEAIKKVCEDSEYRKTLTQRGLKHAKRFNWESSFKKHMDLFETILS
jgi:glycosyltransferase involved in cell wall biosynthesis/GT2 family glycosyltransferase